MYDVRFSRMALKDLKGIARPMRQRIEAELLQLAQDPADPNLDVKAMRGSKSYRLRIGEFRVIYTREDVIKIITVIKVGNRRDAYR